MKHVLLISLGPVQELIAAARKCKDLWFGSWALSELCKAAARGAVEALGGGEEALAALVFPAPERPADLEPGSRMSVANKLVVAVPGDAELTRTVADAARASMLARLRDLRDQAFERVGRRDLARDRHFHLDEARRQVDEVVDFVWVAAAEGGGTAGYDEARRKAERLLHERKNTRVWRQPSWERREGVPKSSIDGARESVLDEAIYDAPVTGPRRPASITPEQRRTWYGVHGAERLCGVGVLKRWGVQPDASGEPRGDRFLSTAHVAATPLMLGIDRDAQRVPEIRDAWGRLRASLGPAMEDLDGTPGRGTALFGHADGAALFSSLIADAIEERAAEPGSESTRRAIEEARRRLGAFLKVARRPEPIPYYAILVADGDSMGKHIGARRSREEHRDYSRRLDAFARSARGIVESESTRGCLIYSGGDDVLAFLPLHQAIECARDLAVHFHQQTGATLSAGMAIVHYTHPLHAALDVARSAEKDFAKVYPDRAAPKKDALAIALDKRSGGTTIACGHWHDIADRLLALAELHKNDAIPDRAGHELAELARLGDDLRDVQHAEVIRDVQRAEALRILRRKRAKRGKEDLAQGTLRKLEGYLETKTMTPAELGHEIGIASLIARAKKQAEPAREEEQ